ncbi:hypothetical protein W97_08995 [Coniosporium apollinis CBS 100218]|uniref:Uncharacterized protein n=1 Tax=Coniosporium apollinis (strain CBS 100218) TaxID=1168221 RepID=R7Z6K3_CONA1|nr:uncharacterized protein W97_08995 [Coniosporium apollinis CBS 100218]EON69733.1 hypothetical protein W97_08995 [Coniosporium apollinis CBS 100218]
MSTTVVAVPSQSGLLTAPGQPSVTVAATSSTTASGSTAAQSLSIAQIAGISAAAVAAVAITVGLLCLLACLQRRDKHADEPRSEKPVGNHRKASPNYLPPPPKDTVKGPDDGLGSAGATSIQHRQPNHKPTEPQWSWQQSNVDPQAIGVALSPEIRHSHSPASVASVRTVSKLLPDKPDPAPPAAAVVSQRPPSEMTVFEEDRPIRKSIFPEKYVPPSHHRLSKALNTSQTPQYLDKYTVSPEDVRRPSLTLVVPGHRPRTYANVVPAPLRLSNQPQQFSPPSRSGTDTTFSESPANSSIVPISEAGGSADYIPDYYTASEATLTVSAPTSRPTTADCSDRYVPYKKPPRTVSRATRDSCASETSFESADPHDPTPEEENDKQLSPVAESPISKLRYPKVPRASNQAVPRSPRSPRSPKQPQHQDSHPPTLLAKRRGDLAAHDLEKRLWITNSNSASMSSHARGTSNATNSTRGHRQTNSNDALDQFLNGQYSRYQAAKTRVAHRHSHGQSSNAGSVELQWNGQKSPGMEMLVKSPLWAPKLTPTKRGDDLFISVT